MERLGDAKDIIGCPQCAQAIHVPELAKYDALLAAAREAVKALKVSADTLAITAERMSFALARLREVTGEKS